MLTWLFRRNQVDRPDTGHLAEAGPCPALLARRFLQQIHIRTVDLSGGAAHADLAGTAAGVALIRLPGFYFSRLVLSGRLRQFRKQKSAIACEAATTCVQRNRYLLTTGARNSFCLLYTSPSP